MLGTVQNPQLTGQPLPIENINSDGTYPTDRVASASDARTIVSILIQSNRERSRLNASVKGMIDGNRPYDQNRLRTSGQLNRTNVNWLEGSAKLSGGLVPYYDLFSGAAHYAEITTYWGTIQNQVEWSRILTEEADRTFKSWDEFDFNMHMMLTDFVAYGKGFLIWPDKRDWRFQAVNQSRFLFPDGTESFPSKWEVVVMRQSFRVNELANAIRDKSAAEKAGWNVEATQDAMFNATPRLATTATTLYDYDYVQQQIKDHDVLQGIRTNTVQAAHVFVKEFDGKITHSIVTEQQFASMASRSGDVHTADNTNFLFHSVGRFDKFSDVICPFIFETLDGSVNGTQGLGHKIFGPMQAKNRLICSFLDLAYMRSGITLQAMNAGALQKLNMVQIGGFNVIPPDFNVQQSSIMGDLDSPLKANRALDILLDNNTGIYRNEGQKEEGNPRTYGEVKLQFMNSAVLSNSAVNRFFGTLDRCYQVTVERLLDPVSGSSTNEGLKMAKDFQDRCIARGVPKEAFSKISRIRAYRPSGNGSPFMRQQSVASLQPLVASFPENGKLNWLQDMVAVTGNQQMVDRYVPSQNISNLPSDQMNEAMIENAVIKMGAPVTWTPTQDNVIHATTHLQAASAAAASISQGGNPQQVLSFLQGIGQHLVQHLQALQSDPMRQVQFKALSAQWEQLAKTTDQIAKHVQEMQRQQAEQAQAQQQADAIQQGTDPQTQIKAAQAQQQMAIDRAKAQQHLAKNDALTKQKLALNDAKAAADLHLKNLEAEAEAGSPPPVS